MDYYVNYSSLFYQNRLRINKRCVETIKSVKGYEWDIKAAQKGIDRPLKQDDHYCDSLRAPIMVSANSRKILTGVIHL